MTWRASRVLFAYIVSREMQSFTRADYDSLATKYAVLPYFYRGEAHGWPDRIAINFGVLTSDMAVAWFGYEHARIAVRAARRLGRPSLVIMGGFEGSDEIIPESSPPSEQIERTRFLLRYSTKVVAVSHYLRRELSTIVNRPDIEVVHNGVDLDKFRYAGDKEDIVLSAGFVSSKNVIRKGHEVFVRAAELVPEARFFLVGKPLDDAVERLRRIATSNVSITGWLSDSDLIWLMRRARVYVQVSSHEAFGCALAEAMSCGCVPVVTRRSAIPEVVGDCGYYVEVGDVKATAEAIRSALHDRAMGVKASDRIRSKFPREKRRDAILRIAEELLSDGRAKTP